MIKLTAPTIAFALVFSITQIASADELDRIAASIAAADTADPATQVVAAAVARDHFIANAAVDPDAAAVGGMLDLSLDRERFKSDPLDGYAEAVAKAADPEERRRAVQNLQREIEDRIDSLLKGFDEGEISVEDAERLLNIAKYAVEAIEDLGGIDPVDGDGSKLYDILNTLHGIASGAKGLEDGSAKDLLEAFRNTLAEITKKVHGKDLTNLTKAFEIPAAVTGGLIDHNRKGLEAITDVIDELPAVMDGDPDALRRMLEGTKKVEEIISGEGYGRAIWDAMSDRIVDRIPFARTLAAWFGSGPSERKLAKWAGDWDTSWNHVRIHPDGTAEPIGEGLFTRRGGRFEITYVTDTTLEGRWYFDVIKIKGDFLWRLDVPIASHLKAQTFTGHRVEDGKGVQLRWDGRRMAE